MMNEILDSLLDDFIYQRILHQSMDSHQKELFKKTNQYKIVGKKRKLDKKDSHYCFICLEKIEDEFVYDLKCRHVFHTKCLETGVSFQHHNCPTCREPIPVRNCSEHFVSYDQS